VDKLTTYRSLIKRLLSEYAALLNRRPSPGIETLCVFDDTRDAYLVVNVGWAQKRRVQDHTLFVRLRNGKIWIEEDGTEDGITAELLEAGVPKEDIVLAFQSPEMRHLTDFAVA
jgi:hypothetical protein